MRKIWVSTHTINAYFNLLLSATTWKLFYGKCHSNVLLYSTCSILQMLYNVLYQLVTRFKDYLPLFTQYLKIFRHSCFIIPLLAVLVLLLRDLITINVRIAEYIYNMNICYVSLLLCVCCLLPHMINAVQKIILFLGHKGRSPLKRFQVLVLSTYKLMLTYFLKVWRIFEVDYSYLFFYLYLLYEATIWRRFSSNGLNTYHVFHLCVCMILIIIMLAVHFSFSTALLSYKVTYFKNMWYISSIPIATSLLTTIFCNTSYPDFFFMLAKLTKRIFLYLTILFSKLFSEIKKCTHTIIFNVPLMLTGTELTDVFKIDEELISWFFMFSLAIAIYIYERYLWRDSKKRILLVYRYYNKLFAFGIITKKYPNIFYFF